MKCTRCGSEVDEKWKFCPRCGFILKRERDFFSEFGIHYAVNEMRGKDFKCLRCGKNLGGAMEVIEGEGRDISNVVVVAMGEQDRLQFLLLK